MLKIALLRIPRILFRNTDNNYGCRKEKNLNYILFIAKKNPNVKSYSYYYIMLYLSYLSLY